MNVNFRLIGGEHHGEKVYLPSTIRIARVPRRKPEGLPKFVRDFDPFASAVVEIDEYDARVFGFRDDYRNERADFLVLRGMSEDAAQAAVSKLMGWEVPA